jgi:methyl-accepting chemotaxis protein
MEARDKSPETTEELDVTAVVSAEPVAEAAVEGRLAARADETRHRGDFRRIVGGVNRLLDAAAAPASEAAEVLGELAKGNLEAAVKGDYRGDHAKIKVALNGTMITLKGYIDEITRVLYAISQGNVGVGIHGEFRGEFLRIRDSVNGICDSLNATLGDINATAGQVASGARQVSDGSQSLSQGAAEQAGAIERLTA